MQDELVVALSHDGLTCRGRRIPLEGIIRADVVYQAGSDDTVEARFHVLHRSRWVVLFSMQVARQPGNLTRALNWLGSEILEHANNARNREVVDSGRVEDVPEALKAMVGAQANVKTGR